MMLSYQLYHIILGSENIIVDSEQAIVYKLQKKGPIPAPKRSLLFIQVDRGREGLRGRVDTTL